MREIETLLRELVAEAEARNRAAANLMYAELCYIASSPTIEGAQRAAGRALRKRNLGLVD